MSKKIIWGIVMAVVVIAGVCAVHYFSKPRLADCCHGEQYDLIPPMADWKTYTNSRYNFSLQFPDSWQGYRVSEDMDAQGVVDIISFGVKDEDKVFVISVLTETQWNEYQKGDLKPSKFLERGNGYVFLWGDAQYSTDSVYPLFGDIPHIVSTFKFIERTNQVTTGEKKVWIQGLGEQTFPVIDIRGIDPFALSNAPVPSLNQEYNGVATTSSATDKDGNIFRFRNYHFDAEQLSKSTGCQAGAFDDLGTLGYTFMDGIPTAVTIVNERTCGTGYFPSVVLYQASGSCQESLSGCLKDTKIAGVAQLYGSDRINITGIDIKPNHIVLEYISHGDVVSTTAELEYVNGKFRKVGP